MDDMVSAALRRGVGVYRKNAMPIGRPTSQQQAPPLYRGTPGATTPGSGFQFCTATTTGVPMNMLVTYQASASSTTSVSYHPDFAPQPPPNHSYALVPPASHYYPRTTIKITTASGERIEISYNMLCMADEAVRMIELQRRLDIMFPGAE